MTVTSQQSSGLQKRANRILDGIIQTGRVANAYIFAGPAMSGKTTAAKKFFRGLNNIDKTQCVDYYELVAEKSTIAIDQIRALQKFVQYGPHELKYLMVVIQNAEKLSADSGNAFLKLLEEPPEGVVFILETTNKELLLKTIISRCQLINFDQLEASVVRDFLQDSPNAEEIAALSGGLLHFAVFLQEQLIQFRELLNFVRNIKSQNFARITQYVDTLGKDKDVLQNYLLLLSQYLRNQGDYLKANLVLKYVKIMQRNINLKLTLEVMLLRMRDL